MKADAPPFPSSPWLSERVRLALQEDLGSAGDVSSDAVFDAADRRKAVVVAKANGVLCGAPLFSEVFRLLNADVRVDWARSDGESVEPGERVAALSGPTRALLAGERTALNFLQRLSGIATLTRRFVDAAGGRLAICDTRKTTPLWRDIEKYAVACGGGVNHRMGLYDMVMLKDTHADGAGGLVHALERVAPLRPGLRVAAEARTMDEVRAALAAQVDLLMLDNMDAATLREAAALAKGRAQIEITGGVTIERLGEFASLGVDRVSVGALTHSAPALDFSQKIVDSGK